MFKKWNIAVRQGWHVKVQLNWFIGKSLCSWILSIKIGTSIGTQGEMDVVSLVAL